MRTGKLLAVQRLSLCSNTTIHLLSQGGNSRKKHKKRKKKCKPWGAASVKTQENFVFTLSTKTCPLIALEQKDGSITFNRFA